MATRVRAAVDAPLFGRGEEIERLRRQVDALRTRPRSLLIRGDPGIGKTAVWRWGVDAHRAAGHGVLITRAAPDELHAPMTGLLDLFDATETAPGALEPDTDVFDRGRAVLETLLLLASRSPVVVAIDDLQWLDDITARSLRYALRRTEDLPIAVLGTLRTDGAPIEIAPVDRVEELVLGPLGRDDVRLVVRTAVGAISRPTLEHLYARSGGNPLYAIELARVGTTGDPYGCGPPTTLHEVLAARLGGVPDDVLDVLRTAAALGPTAPSDLAAACAAEASCELVSAAIADGHLVAGDDGLLRFSHPMLPAVLLDRMNAVERVALHARLAAVVTDPDSRARHLARSCTIPDDTVAAELEAAADRAARHGAPAVAAELADHSVRLTPGASSIDRGRRALAGMTYRAAAGEPDRALAAADQLLATDLDGRQRVDVISLRVFLQIDGADDFLLKATEELGADPAARGRILELQGWMCSTYRGELARAVQLGEQALAIAIAEGDEDLELLAAATLSTSALLAGRPRPQLVDRALDLAARRQLPRLGRWPQVFRARHALWGGDLHVARAAFAELAAAFSHRGVEFQRPYRLCDLAAVEVQAGNLQTALDLADEALEVARDAGNHHATVWYCYPAGLAAAHLGRTDVADRLAAELLTWGIEHGQPPRRLLGLHLAGVIALAGGHPHRAVTELGAAMALAERMGHRHPGQVPVLPDVIEASALAGDAAVCADLAARLEQQATALGAPWVDVAARRGRGLARLAAGDDGAEEELRAAAAGFRDLGHRLDAARTELHVGRAQRRAGQRLAAAATLEGARSEFAAMGATPWVEQVIAELARVPTARREGLLTPTELRIAELVTDGLRNREIAGELLISVATVEAHLTRIYRKLGVRSRTELAQRTSGEAAASSMPRA